MAGPADDGAQAQKEVNKRGHSREIVVDELLCFLSNKLDILPPSAIIQLKTSFYSDEEIEVAKKRLFDLCAGRGTVGVVRYSVKKGPKKSQNNIEDMIKLLNERGNDIPSFVALDLARLPPITFDNIDVSALLARIQKVQDEVSALRLATHIQTDTAQSIKDTVAGLDNRLNRLEVKEIEREESQSQESQGDADMNVEPPTEREPRIGQIGDKETDTNTVPVLGEEKVEAPWATVVKRGRQGNAQEGKNVKQSQNDNNKFVKKRQGGPRREMAVGTARNSGLQVVKRGRRASIFVTGFCPDTEATAVKNYVQDKTDLVVTCDKLESRYDTYSSFHITAMCEDPEVLLNGNIWPDGIRFRWFREPRRGDRRNQ